MNIEQKIAASLENKRRSAESNYRSTLQSIDEKDRQLKNWIAFVKRDGIYVLDHYEVKRVSAYFDVSVFDVLAEKCREWHRPYVKCVSTSYQRYVVTVSGVGPERGLVSHMLLSAEPIKAKQKWSGKLSDYADSTPNLIEETGMEKCYAALAQWTTSRTISLVFQSDAGLKLFREWKEFCLTNKTQRIILGI